MKPIPSAIHANTRMVLTTISGCGSSRCCSSSREATSAAYSRGLSRLNSAKGMCPVKMVVSMGNFSGRRWVLKKCTVKMKPHFAQQVGVLTEAEEQIRSTGIPSQRVYAEVLPLVEEDRRYSSQVEEGNRPTDVKLDTDFLSSVEKRRDFLEGMVGAGARLADERYSDHLAYHSLPPGEVMDKVLRYESRVQKQFDWALQRLLECQQRRKST